MVTGIRIKSVSTKNSQQSTSLLNWEVPNPSDDLREVVFLRKETRLDLKLGVTFH